MPAVQADDISTLPRIAPADGERTNERRVVTVVNAPRMLEGAGFEVRRAFTGVDLTLVDPFLLLDHWALWSMPPAKPRARRTTPIAGSRRSPT